MTYEPFRNVALAVIALAIHDYKQSWRYDAGIIGKLEGYEKAPGAWVRGTIRRWIHSPEFELYAGDIIAKSSVIRLLDQEDLKYAEL